MHFASVSACRPLKIQLRAFHSAFGSPEQREQRQSYRGLRACKSVTQLGGADSVLAAHAIVIEQDSST